MRVDNLCDPFTSEGLIELPELELNAATIWNGFQFEALPLNGSLRLAEPEYAKLTQLQPQLLKLDIEDVPLLDIEYATDSRSLTSDDDGANRLDERKEVEQELDIWTASDLQISRQEKRLVSWDHFVDTDHQEPACRFVSESDPAIYDALLRKILPKTHGAHTRYAYSNVAVTALFELGLGRDSIMFTWDEQSQRFRALLSGYALSGCSRDVLNHVENQYMDAGAQVRRLRNYGQSRSEKNSTRIALQMAIECVLDAFQEVVENERYDTKTLIRLQDTFAKPFVLLDLLDRVVKEVRSASNVIQLISIILAFVEQIVPQDSPFVHVFHEIVSQTLQPILHHVGVRIGLRRHHESSTETEIQILSEILPPTSVELCTQTERTLHILGEHNYNSHLFEGSDVPDMTLKIRFSADEIVTLQNEARQYEQALLEPVSWLTPPSQKESEDHAHRNQVDDSSSNNGPFHFSTDTFDGHTNLEDTIIARGTARSSSLKDTVITALTSDVNVSVDTVSSCRLAIDLSITPLLRAQHRTLSYNILKYLFRDHSFISQARLLGRFLLMIDGSFTSNLSMALFDSNQFSGEGSRRMHSKTGIRLQNRNTWPPASSELRLALMDILSGSTSDIKDAKLVNTISFTIRDLSDEDLERCRDLDSIYALDFLGLSFKPVNSIIEAVVTVKSLEQYDQIFNYLLRLLRLKAVVQSMLLKKRFTNEKSTTNEDGQRFRIEAQQFVSTLANYCTNIVIKTAWLEFEEKLREITDRLAHNDYTGTLNLVSGLDHLRDTHENVLDNITSGLMLGRRQSEAKGIIDRLFEVILRFAAADVKSESESVTTQKNDDSMTYDNNDATTKTTKSRLYKDFQAHMKTLIQWLKAEVGRIGTEESMMYEHLLLGLDWNGFWSR